MEFIYSTGGREKYFKGSNVRDCVCRAICNATGLDYLEVYNGLNEEAKNEHQGKRMRNKSSARNGVYKGTLKRYIEKILGWVWVPCSGIGIGCQVHLNENELPKKGSYILNLSGHLSCVKDGKLYDTYDCSRKGTRCVYGYWRAPNKLESEQQTEAKKLIEQEKEAIELTKQKVNLIKNKYEPKLSKLQKKLKEIQHQLVIETNRMNKEIAKVKKEDGNAFVDKVLGVN